MRKDLFLEVSIHGQWVHCCGLRVKLKYHGGKVQWREAAYLVSTGGKASEGLGHDIITKNHIISNVLQLSLTSQSYQNPSNKRRVLMSQVLCKPFTPHIALRNMSLIHQPHKNRDRREGLHIQSTQCLGRLSNSRILTINNLIAIYYRLYSVLHSSLTTWPYV